MNLRLGQFGFPRRVVNCYLLFCLIAVTWLSIGIVTTARSVLNSRAANRCLSRMGQQVASIEIDYLRNHEVNLQDLVDRAQQEGGLAYCSVVDAGGIVIAHSLQSLVGLPATEPHGKPIQWGSVEGVRYVDSVGNIVREYTTPIQANDSQLGTLRMAITEPSFSSVWRQTVEQAPLTILLPLSCVALGAIVLGKMAQPVAEVDQQLRAIVKIPAGKPLDLSPVPPRGAATVGWNRLASDLEQRDRANIENPIHRRLEAAMESRRQAKSLSILQGLREGVAVTDAEGRFSFANVALASLLGLDPELLGDRTLLDELRRIGRDGATNKLAAAPPMTPVVIELDTLSENRALRVDRQPLDDESGGHVWLVRDVTQQKLAEKSRNEFIDAATHELRTPLANIKAYAETLATCDIDDVEQQKEFCNTINAEATRLARFVDDLLSVSSLEVGSLTVQRQNVEVERLFNEIVAKVKPIMERKALQFDVVAPAKMGEMDLDKDKISAMLVNLLGNAAKYTPEGGRVRLEIVETKDSFEIEVKDSGVGISEEELPRIFEKFFRSDNPDVRNEVGTGLGLALAREIARCHGGDITAQSDLGEGSVFTVRLPLSKETLS